MVALSDGEREIKSGGLIQERKGIVLEKEMDGKWTIWDKECTVSVFRLWK